MVEEYDEDINQIALKVMQIQICMIRWHMKYMADIFDVNGKKADTLTRTQAEILKIVESLERVTVSQLGNIMHISKSSISITVSRMEANCYIERYKDDDEADGRKTFLCITEKGKMALKEVSKKMLEGFSVFYKTMKEEDKESLKNGIDSFYKICVNEED
ncbi:MAG: MarR family transcriptional regulator [Lachnospiraceae bacterium]|nr:MarR family transcriptional regulator [Lachnospiraceae bacterium]